MERSYAFLHAHGALMAPWRHVEQHWMLQHSLMPPPPGVLLQTDRSFGTKHDHFRTSTCVAGQSAVCYSAARSLCGGTGESVDNRACGWAARGC